MSAILIETPKNTSSGPRKKFTDIGPSYSQSICPRISFQKNGPSSLNDAIHNYFAHREVQEKRKLRLLFRYGRVALVTGITFLFGCLLVRKLAASFWNKAASEILAEGMLIIGWVAMWRPLEIFLYEWLPIYRRSQLLQKLSTVAVAVRAKSDVG